MSQNEIQKELEKEKCRVHGKAAKIEIKNGALLMTDFCCISFREKIELIMNKLYDSAISGSGPSSETS